MDRIHIPVADSKVCGGCHTLKSLSDYSLTDNGARYRSHCKQCRNEREKARRVPKQRKTIQDHFWKRVDKSGECWVWTGKKVGNGYGSFSHGTHNNIRHYRAHRLSYEWAYGPIPNGMFVCHKCDNPPCVNPSHLFLGTHQDNVDDKVAKGRQKRNRGHYSLTSSPL